MENETSTEQKAANRIKPVVSGSAIPLRLQRSRQHKQVSPNGLPIVYVGRPTKWGNPFRVVGEDGHWFVVDDDNGEPLVNFDNKKDAIACCVENYKEYISHEHNSGIKNIADLIGKNLSCWCAMVDKNNEKMLCHADILLELATKLNLIKC